ncbi:hypothetical protein Tco_1442799 [Tanacetum coccineum]
MATPIDFSKFKINHVKINKLTKADLVGPIYKLLKGTCQSSIELEYNMEEYYKALSNQLDWNNPKGGRCPFDLSKPLPLKGRPGHLTVALRYFFNNDLEYLKSSDLKKKYTMSIIKMKAARYELVGIEDMIPSLWSVTKISAQQILKHDVYSTLKILSVVYVKVNKLHRYSYLEEIVVRRSDRQLYMFKEGDFINLHLNDIEDMLLLIVQYKLFNLDGDVIVDLAVALHARNTDPKELGKIGWCTGTQDGLQAITEDNMTIQNWRDLPRDITLDRVEVLRYDTKGLKVRMGIMLTKTELALEQTQQGVSDEVLVSIEGVEE